MTIALQGRTLPRGGAFSGGGVIPDPGKIVVDANCESTDGVRTLVYIRGDMVAGRYQVTRADPTDRAKMPVIGVIISKSTPTVCRVQLQGRLQSVFTGLMPSCVYFCGTDGEIASETDPTYPPTGGTSYFQQVGVALASDWMMVLPHHLTHGWAGNMRFFQQALVPTAAPTVFMAPQKFKHGGVITETVYYNGQRQLEPDDYVATESGGAGTGYDQIVFVVAPAPHSNLLMDYVPDV